MKNDRINIMAISGSLRKDSSNTKLLNAAAALAPGHATLTLYDGLGDLPHFNPDFDGDEPPAAVTDLRKRLQAADGVLLCTPEYAGGVPGVLKNALDWIVSSGEFMNKPVAAISASPLSTGGEKALESLVLTLKMLSAALVDGGTVAIPFVNKKMNAESELSDAATAREMRMLLEALAQKAIPHSNK